MSANATVASKLLEVIVTSAEEARRAEEGGAHRLELIRDLALDGLTPPLSVVEEVLRAVSIPVRVMLRDTATFEVADENELHLLEGKAQQFAALPVDGLVLGFLRHGIVDEGAMGRLLSAAGGKSITFHRAIEHVKDDTGAIQTLQNYKQVNRILTNGGVGSWPERIHTLERLQRIAIPGITVLVGGGLDEHVLRLLAESPILNEFHTGRAARDADGRLQTAQVARLRKILDN